MSNLIIVESPTKAKTIGKFLGSKYKVIASNGHVRDLPKSQLGVDVDNNFEPKYITLRGKKSVLDNIRKEAKNADKIFLATDPDREGEAISWHLAHMLKLDEKAVCRVVFNEITAPVVKASIKAPRAIDLQLVDAQQARRVLDRLVGYKISPILWAKVRSGLSAGRVQSVATRIICDREQEIIDFVPQEYWTITALLNMPKGRKQIEAAFYGYNGKKVELHDESSTNEVLRRIDGHDFIVDGITKTVKKLHAPAPFTTSSMQQEASRKLGFTTQHTMLVAQQLFEGIEVGGSITGLITYIRTDSVRVSNEAQNAALEYIKDVYGDKYIPSTPNVYKGRSNAQDAHEAIRPSDLKLTPSVVKSSLTTMQYRLYKLIFDRFIASQMSEETLETCSVTYDANGATFKSTASKVLFDGFTAVYTEGRDENEAKSTALPEMEKGMKLTAGKITPEQKFTSPPPRYTEAALVKLLEEKGIGRPSTFSPTISTIIARGYVKREKKQLVPTELGFVVTQLMKENFEDIVDLKFTADMEAKLDKIEEGKQNWNKVIADFYSPFKESIERASASIEKVTLPVVQSDVVCDKCGALMVYKDGRFGRFLACPNYPECKNTKALTEKTGVSCPKCGKAIIKCKTKKGNKVFYGCEGYPDCDFMLWDKPIDEKCKLCGSIMVQKFARNFCSNPECTASGRKEKGAKGAKKENE